MWWFLLYCLTLRLPVFSEEPPYTLGTEEQESQRLNLQHSIVGQDSRNHLLEAGLKKGMTVLDLGCGNGSMTCWIASQVGENGHVIACDISPVQIERAKKRAQDEGITNVTFVCSDVNDLNLPPNSLDLVYARFFLMHLIDPSQTIKKILTFLKGGGLFAGQEPINSDTYLYPENKPLSEKTPAHLNKIADSYGVDYDIGKRLHTLFYQEGYWPIHLHFSQRAMSIELMKEKIVSFFESIGPAALKTGALSESDLTLHITEIQQYPEEKGSYYVAPRDAHISAYKPSISD